MGESRNGVPDANAGIFVRCEFRSRTKSAENGGVGKIGMSIRRSFEMAVWFRSLQASQKVLRVAVGESERVKPLNFHFSLGSRWSRRAPLPNRGCRLTRHL